MQTYVHTHTCGFGVLEIWVILVVVICSTLRLDKVFRILILYCLPLLMFVLYRVSCSPVLLTIWMLLLVYCPLLTNPSVRFLHNCLYGINMTVFIILMPLLPSPAFHRYWSVSSVLSAACGKSDSAITSFYG